MDLPLVGLRAVEVSLGVSAHTAEVLGSRTPSKEI
jgi:hypothetical protein